MYDYIANGFIYINPLTTVETYLVINKSTYQETF